MEELSYKKKKKKNLRKFVDNANENEYIHKERFHIFLINDFFFFGIETYEMSNLAAS